MAGVILSAIFSALWICGVPYVVWCTTEPANEGSSFLQNTGKIQED